MKKARTITREQLLKLKPTSGEMSEAEFMETPEGKKIADDLMRFFEAKRLLRSELNDGDDGHIDGWLTISKRLGISPLQIKQMGTAEYTSWLAALVREKRREKVKKPSDDPWVFVKLKDCNVPRQNIYRHSRDESKDYIRKTETDGIYEIRQSQLHQYLTPSMVRHYLT